jgi:hypothetical protein
MSKLYEDSSTNVFFFLAIATYVDLEELFFKYQEVRGLWDSE